MKSLPEVTPVQLAEELRSSTPPLLIDVREAHERSISKLPGDLHIPMGEIAGRLPEIDPSKDTVIYCRTGNRSGHIVDVLVARGYRVRNLAGGINAWSQTVDRSVEQY